MRTLLWSSGFVRAFKRAVRRQQIIAARVNELEADYLQENGYRKHWKRRQDRKLKAQANKVSYKKVSIGA